RRSSVAPRIRLAFATRPYRRIIDDHREAARSLRRYGGALRKRLRYRPATPSSGTQPHPARAVNSTATLPGAPNYDFSAAPTLDWNYISVSECRVIDERPCGLKSPL